MAFPTCLYMSRPSDPCRPSNGVSRVAETEMCLMVRKERALGSKRVKSMFVALVGRRGRVAPLLAESEEEEGKDDDTLIVDVVRLITC